MPHSYLPEDFLRLREEKNWILLDTRSPKEFAHAQIPGAVNIPLLNDEQRHEVGTTYKKKGREAAVLKGFDLVGPSFGNFIREVRELSEVGGSNPDPKAENSEEAVNRQQDEKSVLIYCWRGGMRSGIMAWVLGMAGYQTHLLKGGYKAFRNWVLDQLHRPRNFLVLGGHTGAGKTEVLGHLRQLGEQVIDLEGLANHKGSSFGALGQEPQPHYEFFENMLALQLWKTDPRRVIWIENESNSVGSVKVPDPLFKMMRQAPLIEMLVGQEERKKRIHSEYSDFPTEKLAECTAKLSKRLGDLRTKEALTALEEERKEDWLNILMEYYDKTYSHGLKERNQTNISRIEIFKNESYTDFTKRLISFSETISQTPTSEFSIH